MISDSSHARPTLVLMPGMDGTGDLFAPLLAVLQPRWQCQVIRYQNDVCESYEQLTDTVRRSLPNRPYVLVAESFSGPIAVALAAQHPQHLRGLILTASFLRSPIRGWRRYFLPVVRLAMRCVKPPRVLLRFGLVGLTAPAALVRAVQHAIARVDGRVLVHRLDAIVSVDMTERAAQVDVPVLYLRACGDRLVGFDALTTARAVFASFEATHLDGPHLLLQRHPKPAAELIDAFSRCVGQRAPRSAAELLSEHNPLDACDAADVDNSSAAL